MKLSRTQDTSIEGVGQTFNGVEVTDYVAELAMELRNICKDSNQAYLAYLLEIVFIEASELSNKQRVGKINSGAD